MDGVIVNSEQTWKEHGHGFEKLIFGEKILEKIGDTTGTTLKHTYEKAKEYGFDKNLDYVTKEYDVFIDGIYQKTSVVPGLKEFLKKLKEGNFQTAIVSSSRRLWIDFALRKVPYKYMFDLIFSLDEENLPSKPDPKGFIEAMNRLSVDPSNTIILEDSNNGIIAGKKSGAFTIAFTPFLVKGYNQIQADAIAHSIEDVESIIEEKFRKI